jgi:hypothetical protein
MTAFFAGLMIGLFIGCWLTYLAHDWIWRDSDQPAFDEDEHGR